MERGVEALLGTSWQSRWELGTSGAVSESPATPGLGVFIEASLRTPPPRHVHQL